MPISAVKLHPALLTEVDTLCLLRHIMRSDRPGYLWTLSDNSMVWHDDSALRGYLEREWEKYHLFEARSGDRTIGIIAAICVEFEEAKLLVWMGEEYRGGLFGITVWLEFLMEMQKKHIERLRGHIKPDNATSINAAKRFGFLNIEEFTFIEEAGAENKKRRIVVQRQTSFNAFEIKFARRGNSVVLG